MDMLIKIAGKRKKMDRYEERTRDFTLMKTKVDETFGKDALQDEIETEQEKMLA
jgi:hypothetical protein